MALKPRDANTYGIGENSDGTVNIFTPEEFEAYIKQFREIERAAGEKDDLSDLGEIEELFGSKKKTDGEDAAFNESDHPRAPDGRFGTKGGTHGNKLAKKPDVNSNLTTEFGDSMQPVKSLDELYERSKAEEPVFRSMIEGIAKETGSAAKFSGKGGSILKERPSTERKLKDELGGDFTKVRDVLRGTIVSDSVEKTRHAVADFIADQGENILRVKDRIVGPTSSGYRDILVNFRTPGGLVAELQFNSKAMLAAKSEGHKVYERLREIPAGQPTGDFAELEARTKQMYEAAYQADGDGQWAAKAAGASA